MAAHRSRFSYSTMVVQLHVKESAEGSNPSNDYKNAKTATVMCEKYLILEPQGNQV